MRRASEERVALRLLEALRLWRLFSLAFTSVRFVASRFTFGASLAVEFPTFAGLRSTFLEAGASCLAGRLSTFSFPDFTGAAFT